MSLDKYYNILGLQPGASQNDIRKSYRKLVMKYHPDRNPSPNAEEKFIIITEAYEILTGKKSPPVSMQSTRSRSTSVRNQPKYHSAEEEKRERERRAKEARIRYEDYMRKEQEENERYYNHLVSSVKWKTIQVSAIVGIFLSLMMLLDCFLPHHYKPDSVVSYNLNSAAGTTGAAVSLVKTKKGENYWIEKISYSLTTKYPDVLVESSWIFHNPIRLASFEKVRYHYYDIQFNFFRHTWLIIILFLIPAFTIWYKRKEITFTLLYHFSYYGVNLFMIIFLITGDRWAHLLTLGFL